MESKELKANKILNPRLRFLKGVSTAIEFILFVIAAKWLGIIQAIVITVVVFGIGYLTLKIFLKIIRVPLYVIPTEEELNQIREEETKKHKTSYLALSIIIIFCVMLFIGLLFYLNSQGEL